ncbi:MAG: hydrogenase formation protein HypD [Phycisphaerae bacterium]|nr:hydrogenase formation protein HypD [Phycisphaerae bacterium]
MNNNVENLRRELIRLCDRIGRRVQLMEVCGTHTVSAFRSGLKSMLPANLKLLSGPGCPVCVTAQRHIDAALELARRETVAIATYGDMMRVPGRNGSLERLRSLGARIRVVTSARAALELARNEPNSEVVFLGVGFETTAPAAAATVLEAEAGGIENFSVLSCHKLVIPAMRALLSAGDVPIDGFLCPGHVSVIIGSEAYRPIVDDFGKPCVVAGFEFGQMLAGLVHLLRQIECGTPKLENVYDAVVRPEGNSVALGLLSRVFVEADTVWRALGVIPVSGLEFAPAYRRFDALRRFGMALGEDVDHPVCRCGEVIQGRVEPNRCALFGGGCTPMTPIGPCMVSGEGACSAWFKYGPKPGRSAEPSDAKMEGVT